MMNTYTRHRVTFLCGRIEKGEPIGLAEMTWLQKWANANRAVREMLSRARRRACYERPLPPNGADMLLDGLGLGDPDPSTHITKQSDIDDLVNFFKSPDWMRRD